MCVCTYVCECVCVCVYVRVCECVCVCACVHLFFVSFVHRYGPLKHLWSMRYESKHSYFSSHLGNFINVCHTLATRHEQLQCYLRCDDSVFGIDTEVGPGKCNHC